MKRIALVGMIFGLCVVLLSCTRTDDGQPPIPGGMRAEVDYRTPVRLNLNETVFLNGSDTSITLRRLINNQCGLAAYCPWEGRAVHVYIDEKGKRTSAEMVSINYTWRTNDAIVGLLGSDFAEYAIFAFFPLDANLTLTRNPRVLSNSTISTEPDETA